MDGSQCLLPLGLTCLKTRMNVIALTRRRDQTHCAFAIYSRCFVYAERYFGIRRRVL